MKDSHQVLNLTQTFSKEVTEAVGKAQIPDSQSGASFGCSHLGYARLHLLALSGRGRQTLPVKGVISFLAACPLPEGTEVLPPRDQLH